MKKWCTTNAPQPIAPPPDTPKKKGKRSSEKAEESASRAPEKPEGEGDAADDEHEGDAVGEIQVGRLAFYWGLSNNISPSGEAA